MKLSYRYILLILLLNTIGHSAVSAEKEGLEAYTITLNYRQAEDVIPLIRPFLHPQGVMTGEGYKILLKTSKKNYRDLLQFVAEIDVAQRRLLISVTVDSERVMRENRPQAPPPESGRDNTILSESTVKQYTLGKRDKHPLTQQLQVVEGKWAKISTGESVPVGKRMKNPDGTITETISYRSVKTGFQVLPRLSKDRVTLFIRPQLDRQNPEGGGRMLERGAETTVSGKLNQWILIGGASEVAVTQPGSRVYTTEKRSKSHNQIFVKVEVVQ